MAITAIDPKAALVIIDLQKGLLAYPTLHPLPEIVTRAAELAAAFRRHGLPVVLVNAAARAPGRTDQARNALAHAADWLEFVPELGQRPDDLVITKKAPGAFGDSSLTADLRARGVTQVVIVGVSTSNGVEATARGAFDLGFNVTLPVDAMTDMNVESHTHSIERVFPRIAETGTCADVLALLATRGA
jgi:nicotinamidase-related amidase